MPILFSVESHAKCTVNHPERALLLVSNKGKVVILGERKFGHQTINTGKGVRRLRFHYKTSETRFGNGVISVKLEHELKTRVGKNRLIKLERREYQKRCSAERDIKHFTKFQEKKYRKETYDRYHYFGKRFISNVDRKNLDRFHADIRQRRGIFGVVRCIRTDDRRHIAKSMFEKELREGGTTREAVRFALAMGTVSTIAIANEALAEAITSRPSAKPNKSQYESMMIPYSKDAGSGSGCVSFIVKKPNRPTISSTMSLLDFDESGNGRRDPHREYVIIWN